MKTKLAIIIYTLFASTAMVGLGGAIPATGPQIFNNADDHGENKNVQTLNERSNCDQQRHPTNSGPEFVKLNVARGNFITAGVAGYTWTVGDGDDSGSSGDNDSEVAAVSAANGNSIAAGVASHNTTSGDGGDTGSQGDDGSNVIAVGAANGNSIAAGVVSHDTTSGDGGDTGSQGDGDSDFVTAGAANGNSVAADVASNDTSSGDGGDTNTLASENEHFRLEESNNTNTQNCEQQSRHPNNDTDVVAVSAANGNSIAAGVDSHNTTSGDGGDTDTGESE